MKIKIYNRFTYKGKKRLDKDDIPQNLLEKIEARLFKTKGHLKRGQGISQVPYDVSKEYLSLIDDLLK